MQRRGRLVTADGLEITGGCLYEKDDVILGELVFSTSMTGYTEILTDPSFYGQIVVLAYPEVGNYGINTHDFQSDGIKVKGLVVRNLSSCTSSFRSHLTLADLMLREEIPLFYGVDTRALITHIRDHGSMIAVITKNSSITSHDLWQRARSIPSLFSKRLSDFVSVKEPTPFHVDTYDLLDRPLDEGHHEKFHVIAIDFGVKYALIGYLERFGAKVTLVPTDITAPEIWSLAPDGLFLSNGPGDPALEKQAVTTVQSLLGKLPIFGVCMGHQILAQAVGLSTYKLKFGHRGSNQAVRTREGSVITTAQNHGFAVMSDHHGSEINIIDKTNEGLDLPSLQAFSVQFHPEGAPGPLDALFYFEKFLKNISAFRGRLDGKKGLGTKRVPTSVK